MKKTLIRVSVVALGVVVVCAAALYLFTQAVLESYRPQLEARLSEAMGCPVRYSRATLRLTRDLRVVMYNVDIQGAELGFEVKAPRLGVKIEIPPLLNGEVQFNRIELLGPAITLLTGRATPGDSKPAQSAPSTASSPTMTAESRRAPFPGIKSISITHGALTTRNPKGEVLSILEDVTISSALHSKAEGVSLGRSSASFVLPAGIAGKNAVHISASLDDLSYNLSPRALIVTEAKLVSGDTHALLSGRVGLDSGESAGTFRGEGVDLSQLSRMPGFEGLRGKGSVTADFSQAQGKTRITGAISASDVRAATNNMQARQLLLEDVLIEEDVTTGAMRRSATATVKDLSLVVASGERYGVGSLKGPVEITTKASESTTISSKALTVENFSYKDKAVSIEKVDGDLLQIKGAIAANGAADFSLRLNGKGIQLTTTDFVIKSVQSVAAPLRVVVPASGGYAVTGPVKASGGQMSFYGRDLSNVRGEVDMRVASDGLRFSSTNLSAESVGQPIAMRGTLTISDTVYEVPDLMGRIAGGTVSGALSMQRDPNTTATAKIEAKGIRFDDLNSILHGHKASTLGGIVSRFTASVSANKRELLSSAKGQGHIDVSDGSLQNVRFDKQAVSLLKAIPVVGSAFSFQAEDKEGSAYKMQGGSIKGFSCDFVIADGGASTKNLTARGRYSNIEVSGKVTFEGNVDAQASVVFLEENIKSLAGPVKLLGGLMGSIGRIEIPVLIRGPLESPSVSADISRLHKVSVPGRAVGSIVGGIGNLVMGEKTATP